VSNRHWADRDMDKEKAERKRQYPYHMHMSLDMLDAVHLLSAMFVEVPHLAIHGAENKKRVISKYFRRFYDHHQRQSFTGPPENTRDLIMCATKQLRIGHWQRCVQYLNRLKMWELMPYSDLVKNMVIQKVKEEALRAYLFTYGSLYVAISLATLQSMFDLPSATVYRMTSKMMVNEQLQGAWDQPSQCIVMHGHELTRLQKAALRYSDKGAQFLELNERAVGYGQRDRGGGGGGDRGGGGGDRSLDRSNMGAASAAAAAATDGGGDAPPGVSASPQLHAPRMTNLSGATRASTTGGRGTSVGRGGGPRPSAPPTAHSARPSASLRSATPSTPTLTPLPPGAEPASPVDE